MKMIKITTDNQISVHDFPERSFEEQNKSLRDYIGPKCELFERVMPKRLYNQGKRELRKYVGGRRWALQRII